MAKVEKKKNSEEVPEGFYQLSGHCMNCGHYGPMNFKKGQLKPIMPIECPKCGCTKMEF